MIVYIAGPYTKGDVAVNVKSAIAAGEQVFQAGHTPFVPHLTHFFHMLHPHSYEHWMNYDSVWLTFCDVVIRLPGDSVGADQETEQARLLNKKIYYGMEAFLNDHKH